jgi:hypothetical protein
MKSTTERAGTPSEGFSTDGSLKVGLLRAIPTDSFRKIAKFADRDAQMSFDWEFPPVIQQPTTEDEIALCNWENEGGAPGRTDADE